MAKRIKAPKSIDTAHDHYLRGADLEEDDASAARQAYEACLEGDCTHMNARINLGRLLHAAGKHREAESVYRATEEPDAILFFNLGVLLDDLGRTADAINAYKDALIHDPGLADAHFNLALLHEHAGETQAAFRHLLAYRRLMRIETSLRR
jgi:tetratricopeptide (TPR) repeat protein